MNLTKEFPETASHKIVAVIVAGGQGVRMGTALPKQFLPLKNKPVLYYTIRAFTEAITDIKIVLVLPAEHISYINMVLQAFEKHPDLTIIPGGETRYESVQNGLKEATDSDIIFVHDGVRPLLSRELIRRCYAQALELGSAIPAITLSDSMRQLLDDGAHKAINRERLRSVQTPQTFRSDILLKAFEQPYQEQFTDEATVVEASGTKVFLIEGTKENIKITTPEDLIIAEAFMNQL